MHVNSCAWIRMWTNVCMHDCDPRKSVVVCSARRHQVTTLQCLSRFNRLQFTGFAIRLMPGELYFVFATYGVFIWSWAFTCAATAPLLHSRWPSLVRQLARSRARLLFVCSLASWLAVQGGSVVLADVSKGTSLLTGPLVLAS